MQSVIIKDKDEQEWDMVIKPKGKLFDLNLREIWSYRDLMLLFVKRDFTAQYKQTILGPLWHIIQPIFTTLMFLLVIDSFISNNDGCNGTWGRNNNFIPHYEVQGFYSSDRVCHTTPYVCDTCCIPFIIFKR